MYSRDLECLWSKKHLLFNARIFCSWRCHPVSFFKCTCTVSSSWLVSSFPLPCTWALGCVLPNYYNHLSVQIFNKLNVVLLVKVFCTLCIYTLKKISLILKNVCFPGMTPDFPRFVVCWEEGWQLKDWNSLLLLRWVMVPFPDCLLGFSSVS